MRHPSRLKALSGFTLVELLVVILIIAILMAVAAPSFLGQTKKAQDSVAKQELTISWKAAIANAVNNPAGQGHYFGASTLAGPGSDPDSIKASEPELTVSKGNYSDASSSASPSHIFVSPGSSADEYIAFDHSDSGTVWCILAPSGGQQTIVDTGCPGSAKSPVLKDPLQPPAGTPAVGKNLVISSIWTTDSPLTTVQIKWMSCGSNPTVLSTDTYASADGPIDPESVSDSYTIMPADIGSQIKAVITVTSADGSTTEASGCTDPVPAPEPGTSCVPTLDNPGGVAGPEDLSYALFPGYNATLLNVHFSGCSDLSYTYRWYVIRDGGQHLISGASGAAYNIPQNTNVIGENLTADVTAHSSTGSAIDTGVSPSLVQNPAPVSTGPPGLSGDGPSYTISNGPWKTDPSPYNPTSYNHGWCPAGHDGVCLDGLINIGSGVSFSGATIPGTHCVMAYVQGVNYLGQESAWISIPGPACYAIPTP